MDDLAERKTLPVCIVDYHQDVLLFLLRKIGSKRLKISGNCLVHFDSHPDLQVPDRLSADEIAADPKSICDRLTIGDWILPACYYGIFECVYWLKMSWSRQLPDIDSQLIAIGKSRRDGLLKVNYGHRYFAGANAFESSLDQLSNIKWFRLSVKTIERADDFDFGLLKTNDWILDIDLDYFTTRNPFRAIYNEIGLYEILENLFEYEGNGSETIEVFSAEYRTQSDCLNDLFEAVDRGRNPHDVAIDSRLSAKKVQLFDQMYRMLCDNYTEIDWQLIRTAGATCGDSKSDRLPEHLSTRTQLLQYLDCFRDIVTRFEPDPKLIMVSRSVSDEYTPVNDCDWLQARLLDVLATKYTPDIVYDYLN